MAGGRGVAVSLVVTACAGAVCCVDAVAAADAGVKQIALVPNATELEGFDGRLVWSRKDPSTKRFVLMTHYRGRVSKVPVASRVSAFDVDLGPDRAGRTVAVYSRCRGAANPRRCVLFLYDFARHRERELRRVGEPGRSEFEPSVWRDRIAFASRPDRPGTPDDALGEVRVRSLSRRGRTQRFSGSIAPLDTGLPRAAVSSIDLRGERLAYTWAIRAQQCRAGDMVGEPDPTGTTGREHRELWLADGDGTQTLVEKGCDGDRPTAFLNPYLTQEALHYGVVTDGLRRWWVRTYRSGSGQYAEARTVEGLQSYVPFGVIAWRARGYGRTRIESVPPSRLTPTQAYQSTSGIGPPTGTTLPAQAR